MCDLFRIVRRNDANARITQRVQRLERDGVIAGYRAEVSAERLGLVSIHTFVGDARDVPIAPASFDRVLLDAPCSGLGVLRRRAEARWRISPDDPEVLGKLQQEMLLEASRLVKPGGLLAYSVCTLSSDETIGVDKWAQSALPRFEAQPIPASPWIAHGRGALLTPDAAGTDGMYLLLLKAPE